jgi:hypothetical protein
MKNKLYVLLACLLVFATVGISAITNSADNPRNTFNNGYQWGGHVPKDKATLWAQDIEDGVMSHTAAGTGPSPAIWNNCPFGEYSNGIGGMAYFNDFGGVAVALANNNTTGTVIDSGIVGSTAATAATTISMLADEATGAVALKSSTDNEDAIINILGGANTAGQIKLASSKKFWFEARIKSLNTTDAKFGIFCGFMEEARCDTTEVIGADGALTDVDYLGFHKLEADGDKMDTVFNTASGGTSPVTIQADAVTLVADTYIKIGIYSDGTTVTLYASGAALTTTTTIAATDFPDSEEMGFYFCVMNAASEASEGTIDWVRVAMEY